MLLDEHLVLDDLSYCTTILFSLISRNIISAISGSYCFPLFFSISLKIISFESFFRYTLFEFSIMSSFYNWSHRFSNKPPYINPIVLLFYHETPYSSMCIFFISQINKCKSNMGLKKIWNHIFIRFQHTLTKILHCLFLNSSMMLTPDECTRLLILAYLSPKLTKSGLFPQFFRTNPSSEASHF